MTLLFFGGNQLGAASSAVQATVEQNSRQRNKIKMPVRREPPDLDDRHQGFRSFVNAVGHWRRVSDDQSVVDSPVLFWSRVMNSICFGVI